MPCTPTNPWNTLEAAKLVASMLTPIALAIVGIYIHRITKRFEHIQWRSQKLIEKRLEVYDNLAPMLNDVLCYFNYNGLWKELEPLAVIRMKRQIDKAFHLASPSFSKEFFGACMNFQKLCFGTFSGWGKDALLRTNYQRRKDARTDWNDAWNDCFSGDVSDPKAIRDAYRKIMDIFARDIGVHSEYVIPPSGRSPSNIL